MDEQNNQQANEPIQGFKKNWIIIISAIVVATIIGLTIYFITANSNKSKQIKLQEEIASLKKSQIIYDVIDKDVQETEQKSDVKKSQINVAKLVETECKPVPEEKAGPCFDFSCFCFKNENLKNELNEFMEYFKNNEVTEANKAIDILGSPFNDLSGLNICHLGGSCYSNSYFPIRVFRIKDNYGILFYKTSGQDINDRTMAYVYYKDGNLNIIEYQLEYFLEKFIKNVE